MSEMPSLRDVMRSAVTRFLPGWLLALIALTLVFAPHSFAELGARQIAFLSSFTAAALGGHVAALAAVRRFLRADADIVGRKSVVAGLCSVGAFLITSFVPHGFRGVGTILATYFAVGAGVTLALYFPWIRIGTARRVGQ